MKTKHLLEKAKAILQLRLEGLRAIALVDVEKSCKLQSSVDTGNFRLEGFIDDIPSIVRLARSISESIGDEAQCLVFRYPENIRTSIVISRVYQDVWSVVLADDKFGDILFHNIWSRDPSLGAMPYLREGVKNSLQSEEETFLCEQPLSPKKVDVKDEDKLDVVLKASNELEPKDLEWLRHHLEGLSYVADLYIENINGSSPIASVHLSESRAPNINEVSRFMFAAADLSDSDVFGKADFTSISILGTDGYFNFYRMEKNKWRLFLERGDSRNLGRSSYWLTENYQMLFNTEDHTHFEQNVFGLLSDSVSSLHNVFMLALGNWRDKLPYGRPILFTNPDQIGEYFGLADIATSVIEIGQKCNYNFGRDECEHCSIDFILFEYELGCSVIFLLDQEVFGVIAAREKAYNVVSAIKPAVGSLREIFSKKYASKISERDKPQKDSVRGQFLAMKLAELEKTSIYSACEDIPNLRFSAIHPARKISDIYQPSNSLAYSIIHTNNMPEGVERDFLSEIDNLVNKSVIYSKFALGDCLGELNGITLAFSDNLSLAIRKTGLAHSESVLNSLGTLLVCVQGDSRAAWDAAFRIESASLEENTLENDHEALKIASVSFFYGRRQQQLLFDNEKAYEFSSKLQLSRCDLSFTQTQKLLNDHEMYTCHVIREFRGIEEIIYVSPLSKINYEHFSFNLPFPEVIDSSTIFVRVVDSSGVTVAKSKRHRLFKVDSAAKDLANSLGGWKSLLAGSLGIPCSMIAIPMIETKLPSGYKDNGSIDKAVSYGTPLLLFIFFFVLARVFSKKRKQ
ncbi:MAG: hypothetical protein AAF431_12975 [Pseudomonadota bacterium]